MSLPSRVITIDGPAASGKGTLARNLSADLGFYLLDSGLLYRIVALAAWQRGIDLHHANEMVDFTQNHLVFWVNESGNHESVKDSIEIHIYKHVGLEDSVRIDDVNVNLQLRSHEIGSKASIVAAIPDIRQVLIPIQRSQVQGAGLVADGRDMGTVIFPDADVKFYLDADLAERARRRTLEIKLRGESADFEQIQSDLAERDRQDQQRAVAPLKVAEDSVVVDATNLTIHEMVTLARSTVEERLGI